ncbi:MAG TPA: hypothetical protein VFD58_22105 [Blastocatellia bacterium]|nr:hypothetical protein [Blastocatellia bacterium]
MKKFSRWILTLSLILGAASPGVSAAGLKGKKTTRPAGAVKPAVSAAPVAADDTLVLLPKSDVVIVLDAGRLLNDVLPKIKAAWPQASEKPLREFNEFLDEGKQYGVDISKIKSVSLGLRLFEGPTVGAMIMDGLSINQSVIDALMKDEKGGKATSITHKGKTIYLFKSTKKEKEKSDQAKDKEAKGKPDPAPSGDMVGSVLKMDDNTAFAQLDQQRVVLGDQNEVKAVIDVATGGANPAGSLNAALTGALKETKSASVIRFAINLPDSARQWLAAQDYFKDMATMKMIFGALDIGDDLSLSLDAKARTGSNDEATKLEAALNGLLAIGKMMTGGNEDPKMKVASQFLNQIKLGSQTTDVSLSITVPRSFYDEMLKEQKPAPAKPDKQ